jgi:subtilisin family serine protease
MNRRYLSGPGPLLLALAVAAPLLSSTPSATAQEKASSHAPGQFLVSWANQSAPLVLAPGINPAPWKQQRLRAQVSAKIPGAKISRTFQESGWSLISVPKGSNDSTTRARLAATLGTDSVTYNYRRKVTKIANDPQFGSQWHLPKIKAPEAWGTVTSSNVVVAVLDTGVDLAHPDIQTNLWKNPGEIANNRKDDDNNGYIDDVYGLNGIDPSTPPQDEDGHGTHCAGLIGAIGSNSRDVTGVCWKVKILPLKFMGSSGEGFDSDAIECIEYAVNLKKKKGINIRVISSSFSGPDNPALKAAYQRAESADMLNVCAAGNATTNIDQSPTYPASFNLTSILSVAATNPSDELAGFSNYGAKQVDLAAPGTTILSLKLGGGTRTESGTSMSTPIVAGAAALIAGREPTLKAASIKSRILSTVDKVPGLKGKVASGGRLNLQRAITNATLSISGLVYRLNGTTKQPLAGANILIKGKVRTSTDRSGKYQILDLSPATYDVTATLSGYSFTATSIALPTPKGTKGTPNGVVDFASTKVPKVLYSIIGYARDSKGVPQKDVAIFINGTSVPVAVTSSIGKYTIRDRNSGTYKLTASSPNVIWTPDVTSVALPTKSPVAGAPNGIVNFTATVPDTQAPTVGITNPANKSTVKAGDLVATGTATDQTGLSQIFFQLSRLVGDDYAVYEWNSKTWVGDDGTGDPIEGSQNASGTNTEWSLSLPNLVPGSYQLLVRGKDVLGNESTGEANAVSSFTVTSTGTTSSVKRGALAAPVPSGGKS